MTKEISTHCFHAVIDAALDKKVPLTLEVLNGIADSGTTLQEMVIMLCEYINSTPKAAAGEVQAWCDLVMHNRNLQERVKTLSEECGKAMTKMLEARANEAELLRQAADRKLETAALKAKIKDLESRLHIMDLLQRTRTAVNTGEKS